LHAGKHSASVREVAALANFTHIRRVLISPPEEYRCRHVAHDSGGEPQAEAFLGILDGEIMRDDTD